MDSFELNKILGAGLFALLMTFGLSALIEPIFHTEAPETPGYVIAVATEGEAEGHGGGDAPASEPIGVLLAAADAGAGESSAKKCGACHTFAAGEPNKVGPNLYGIVTAPIASHEGYEYSAAMTAFAQEAQTWDYEHLNTYLLNPKGVVPGTKMAFAGLKNDSERANVIAYLRTLSDSPAPLPEPEAAAPAEGEAEGADAAAPEGEATVAEAQAPGAEAEAPVEAEAPAAEAAAPTTEAEAPAEGEQTEAPAATAETETPAEEPAGTAEAPAPEAPAAEQEVAQAEGEPAAAEGGEPAAAGADDSGLLGQIAAADVAKGENFAKRCAACHTFDSGGANKVGPNLWGIVNRPVATHPDYAYSDAMIEFSEGGQKLWDFATLAPYLENPKNVVPGGKMIFPGIKKPEDLANVLAYLRTLSDSPAPLP